MLDQKLRAAILALHEKGRSKRSIAKALKVSRDTVKEVLASGSMEVPLLVRPQLADGRIQKIDPVYGEVYAAAGKYLLTAVVTDGGGAVGSGQALEVIVPQVPPVVVAPADQTADRAEGWLPPCTNTCCSAPSA